MNTKKFVALLIWVITLFMVLNVGFEVMNMSDTFANIFGFVIIAVFVFVTYKTDCFTNIKFKKK